MKLRRSDKIKLPLKYYWLATVMSLTLLLIFESSKFQGLLDTISTIILIVTLFTSIIRAIKYLVSKLKQSKLLFTTRKSLVHNKIYSDKVSNRVDSQIEKYDYIVLDFETANNKLNSVCSFGIVAVENNKIVNELYYLINPEDSFNSKNIEIHGITPEDVINSPTFLEVYDEFKSYINSANYIIAHNAQFDMSVLHHLSNKYNLQDLDFNYIDSINFTKPQTPNTGNSLAAKLEYFGLTNVKAHNALEDSRATYLIINESINSSPYSTIDTYINGYKSVKINKYGSLKPSSEYFHGKSFGENVKISSLEVSENAIFDINHTFYNKTIVITGTFTEMSRKEMMQKIIDIGGIIRSSVSGKTNILLVGTQDKSIVGPDGMSTKHRKALELIDSGKNLKIIKHSEVIDLLNYK